VTPANSVLLRGRDRRSSWALVAASCLVLLAFVLTAFGYVTHSARHSFLPDLAQSSDAVGRSLARQVDRAVALGIPFTKLVGMDVLLESTIASNPRIGFAVVTDSAGAPLYAAGTPLDAKQKISVSGSLEHIEGYVAVPIPLSRTVAGAPRGFVLVGFSEHLPAADQLALVAAVIPLFVSACVLAWEAGMALCSLLLFSPAAALRALADSVEAGDFSVDSDLEAAGPRGQALAVVRRRLARLNDAFHELCLGVFAARSGHFEQGVLHALERIDQRFARRYLFRGAAGLRRLTVDDTALRRAALIPPFAAEGLLWVPLLGVTQSTVPQLFSSGGTPLPFIVLIAAAALGFRIGRGPLRGFPRGLLYTMGALVAGASIIVMAFLADGPSLLAARACCGLGYGLAVVGALGQAPIRQPSRTIAPALLVGVGVGVGLGLLMAPVIGSRGIAGAAGIAVLAAGLVGGLTLPRWADADPAGKAVRFPRVTALLVVAGLAFAFSSRGVADLIHPAAALWSEPLAALSLGLPILVGGALSGMLGKRRWTRPVSAASLLLAAVALVVTAVGFTPAAVVALTALCLTLGLMRDDVLADGWRSAAAAAAGFLLCWLVGPSGGGPVALYVAIACAVAAAGLLTGGRR